MVDHGEPATSARAKDRETDKHGGVTGRGWMRDEIAIPQLTDSVRSG
jgi:hypothetical protein